MTFSSFYVIFFFYLFVSLKKGRCNDIDKILDLLPVSGPVSYVTVAMVTRHAFQFWAVEVLPSVSKGRFLVYFPFVFLWTTIQRAL